MNVSGCRSGYFGFLKSKKMAGMDNQCAGKIFWFSIFSYARMNQGAFITFVNFNIALA